MQPYRLDSPTLQRITGGTAFDALMQGDQIGRLLVAGGMILLLLMLGFRRRDIFLTLGNPTAPIRPVPALGFRGGDSWVKFGLIWGLGVAAALVVVQSLLIRPDATQLHAVVPVIPGILLYAAANAFSEEMTYRVPLVAVLEPVVGSRSALWQSAVFFGIAHYFGTPGGLAGVALSTFFGWLLAKSLIETRGLLWAWFLHFLSDVAIFVFLAISVA